MEQLTQNVCACACMFVYVYTPISLGRSITLEALASLGLPGPYITSDIWGWGHIEGGPISLLHWYSSHSADIYIYMEMLGYDCAGTRTYVLI